MAFWAEKMMLKLCHLSGAWHLEAMRLFFSFLLASSILLPLHAGENVIASERHEFRLVTVADHFEHPWGLAFLPDGGLLVTERPGRIQLGRNGEWEVLQGTPEVAAVGQGGLLDIALDPDFARNQLIYLSYAVRRSNGLETRVARARLVETSLEDLEVIFSMDQASRGGQHFGSRLLFDRDGYLYVTIGDRGQRHRAQDPFDPAGSTLRIYPDGSIPADNPFADGQEGHPAVYSFGHRNAQGMALHPETGQVWQNEHGPRGGDELNLVGAGLNYGWPVITHGREYVGGSIGVGTEKEGMESPIVHWTPSIAVSGMTFYRGDQFPRWQGNIFVGALAQQHLRRLVLRDQEVIHQEVLLHRSIGRIRDVREGPEGAIWILTDERSGGLYRLEAVSD